MRSVPLSRSTLLLASALSLGACADVTEEGEQLGSDSDVLARTVYPPQKDAELVDWRTAGKAGTDPADPRSDFRRAQHLMARLANASYDNEATFTSEAAAHGFKVTGQVHEIVGFPPVTANVDAYAGESEKGTMNFIALAGTSGFEDFLTDILVVPTTQHRSGGTVHLGFGIYADTVYARLKAAVASSCPAQAPSGTNDHDVFGGGFLSARSKARNKPLWITGHSLGGAAASILAERLAKDGCNVAGVSVFGSPRPGFSDFQAGYHGQKTLSGGLYDVTQRYVNHHDPVYCLAPGGAWDHVGVENRIEGHLRFGTNYWGSECNSFEEWTGGIKAALSPLGGSAGIPGEIHEAVNDWIKGLFDLTLVCQDGHHWDELWSLGGCAVTDYTNRLVTLHNISPQDFLQTVLRVVHIKSHAMDRYEGHLTADFTQGGGGGGSGHTLDVAMHQPRTGKLPTVYDDTTGAYCTPERGKDTLYHCYFEKVPGTTAKLRFEGATPAQSWYGPVGCTNIVRGPSNITCSVPVNEDTEVHLFIYI